MPIQPYEITAKLDTEQIEALAILPTKRRFFLGDSTGNGKTLSILASAQKLVAEDPERHILILGPKSAYATWKEQIAEHTTAKAAILTTGEYAEEDSTQRHITFMTYPMLEDMKETMAEMYVTHHRKIILVLEEAQYCKNHQKTRSILVTDDEGADKVKKVQTHIRSIVAPLVKFSEYCWAMSATPLMNNITDLYGLFDLLMPGYLGTEQAFLRYYTIREKRKGKAGHSYWTIVKYQNLSVLKEKISPYILKRVREYNVQFFYHKLKLSPVEEGLYLDAAKGILGEEERDFAGRLPDLQRVVDNAVLGDREVNRTAGHSTKERVLLDKLREQLQAGEGVIVFAEFRDTINRLEFVLTHAQLPYKRLIRLDASSSVQDRIAAQQAFGPGILLLMSNVGRESLNLQAGHIIWMYDIPFSMGSAVQLVGRIARKNSKFDVFEVHIPLTLGTIDEYKAAMLHHKADLFRAVLQGERTMPKSDTLITREILTKMRKHLLWRCGMSKRKSKAVAQPTFQWEDI